MKTLMRTSPLSLMTGSPLTTFYLRAMGAKVGRNVTIMTNRLPVCTDLLTIGEGTVIRKDAFSTVTAPMAASSRWAGSRWART